MKKIKLFFLVTDIGFIIYWLITIFHLIPKEIAFKDYDNPILVAWNYSFFPLDIFISITGLTSLYLYIKENYMWKNMVLISMALTFCSGLQAISFWAINRDFDALWWIFNGYLMIYPLFFIKKLVIGNVE